MPRNTSPPLFVLVVDCLTAGKGDRVFTRDFIGAGPRYIAGFIEDISARQTLTTLTRGEDLATRPQSFLQKFHVLCISAMTMDIGSVRRVLKLWKQAHTNPSQQLTILGGPITSDPRILQKIQMDVAIPREGETPIESLFKGNIKDLQINLQYTPIVETWKETLFNKIPGIMYREQDHIRDTLKLKLECTENSYFPTSSGYPKKIRSYSDFTSSRVFVECLRGCSNFRRTALELHTGTACEDSTCEICRKDTDFSTQLTCPIAIPPGCGFCSTISEFGPPTSRNIDSILTEIQALIAMGVSRIVLGGPDFLDFHRERLVEGDLIHPSLPEPNYSALETLIDGLLEMEPIRHHHVQLFIENIKATLCTDRALDLLAKIPHAIFSIGCETGSEEFANILGRPGSPLTTLNAVQRAIARNIRVHVYFIHSLPGDTPEYAQETLDLMQEFARAGIDKITIYRYQELPGAPFYKMPRHYTRFPKQTEKLFTKIKKFSIQFNRRQKEKLVGSSMRVFLSEVNKYYPDDAMGWILEGGPKVSVKGAVDLVGTFQDITIIQVLSDRLVLGEII